MTAFTDALTRLASYFNGSAYDASTNPGGLAAGGHRSNFTPALQDVATVGAGISTLATDAATSATSAANSATTAVAAATSLSGTSSTPKTITTGSFGPLATQTGKAWSVGSWVNARSAANPTLNYVVGQVTAYTGGNLTLNVTATGGSGNYSDWVIDLSSPPGQAGGVGPVGGRGPTADFQITFSSGTTDSDPGNGEFKFSSGTLSGASFLYIDNLNSATQAITAWLDALDDSTTSTDRGRLRLYDPAGSGAFVEAKVTGAVVDGGGYRKVPIVVVAASVVTSGAPPFSNGNPVAIHFTSTGNKGIDGAGAGDTVGPSSATDNALPLFDTSTGKLLKDSAVGIGTSGANLARLDTAATVSGARAHAAKIDMQQDVALSGDITPTQITANQNDYSPAGLSTSTVLRLSTDAVRNVSGLGGGYDGRLLIVRNIGAFDVVLNNQSASSTAGNRFAFSGDRNIRPGFSDVLFYDSTLSRWVALGPLNPNEVIGGRERLIANRTYFYRADGSDSNTGLVNSTNGAFLTAQKAYDTICDKLDLAGFNTVIQCGSAPGTVFTSGITTSKSATGNSGGACITWDGNNSIVRVTNGPCLSAGSANGFGGSPQLEFQNIRFETITSGDCIDARGGILLGGHGVVFGPCAGSHVFAGHLGQIGFGNYEIAGGAAQSHLFAYAGAFIFTEGATTTISAPVTFGASYVTVIQGAIALVGGQTFVNPSNVTGSKFIVREGACIDTGGAALSYLPGTVAGIIQSGGCYDDFTDTGWAAFTPTISPAGGSFTSVTCPMRFKQIGKTVHYSGMLTTTTIGSATGTVTVSLPVPPFATAPYTGTAFTPDGMTLLAATINLYSAASLTLASVASGAPTTSNGHRVVFSGTYEAA
ncbi:hypothetical protein V1281_002577 [Nitrobacteraceae bacterium AZCC 2161]